MLGVIVLVGMLLRLRWLGEPMRWDEAATFQEYARASIGTITSSYVRPNNQIFYTLLSHFGIQTLGEAVWAVRFVAFAAGVGLIPAAYLAARRVFADRLAGLWAAALTAGFGPLVDYSVNGRGYTLGALFVVLALWLGAVLLDGSPSSWGSSRSAWAAWAGFVVCSVLAVYTLPTMAIGVAAVALWMALNWVRTWRKLVVLAGALTVAGGLSLLLYSAVLGQHGWTAVTPAPREWGAVKALASAVWENWNRAAPHPLDWLVAAAFLVSVAVGLRGWAGRGERARVPLAVAMVVVLLGVALVAPIAPFVRSWLFVLPLYLIQASGGFAWVVGRVGGRGLVAILVPACVAVVFGATMLHAGLRGSDVPPSTDNDIVGLLRRYVPAREDVLIDRYARAPIHYYYFTRFGDHTKETGTIRSADRRRGHIVVVVPRGTSPWDTVYKAGGLAASTTPPVLARREWITIYDVPLLQATPQRLHFRGPSDRPQ